MNAAWLSPARAVEVCCLMLLTAGLVRGGQAPAGPEPGAWRTLAGEIRTAREIGRFLKELMPGSGADTLSVAVVQDGRVVYEFVRESISPAIAEKLIGDSFSPFRWMRY